MYKCWWGSRGSQIENMFIELRVSTKCMFLDFIPSSKIKCRVCGFWFHSRRMLIKIYEYFNLIINYFPSRSDNTSTTLNCPCQTTSNLLEYVESRSYFPFLTTNLLEYVEGHSYFPFLTSNLLAYVEGHSYFPSLLICRNI